jgi:hypothetical protein
MCEYKIVSACGALATKQAGTDLCQRKRGAAAQTCCLVPLTGWLQPGKSNIPLFESAGVGSVVSELDSGNIEFCHNQATAHLMTDLRRTRAHLRRNLKGS